MVTKLRTAPAAVRLMTPLLLSMMTSNKVMTHTAVTSRHNAFTARGTLKQEHWILQNFIA